MLVAELIADHISGGQFRHGSRLLRWRTDKNPEEYNGSAADDLTHAESVYAEGMTKIPKPIGYAGDEVELSPQVRESYLRGSVSLERSQTTPSRG